MISFFKRLFTNSSNSNKSKYIDDISISYSNESYNNPSRDLLKEATQLKRDKKYDEACAKLKEAYSSDGGDELMLKERIRLPMYLQLAGKGDEGWGILNELNLSYVDVFSQVEIANQMRVFLQKEKKHKQAIMFGAWCVCKEIEASRANLISTISSADEMARMREELQFLDDGEKDREVYGKTHKGNPITDSAYEMFMERIERSLSLEGAQDALTPLLKKAKMLDKLDALSVKFNMYLQGNNQYDLREVRDIFSSADAND